MAVPIKSLSVIRAELLRDFRSLRPDAGIASDSDFYARASAVASALEGVYSYLVWQGRQRFADTADSDVLDRHAAMRGLSRKAASRASGSATVTGSAGALIASGVSLTDGSGLGFVSTASTNLPESGTANVLIRAVAAGAAGNLAAGTVLELSGAASEVDASAVVFGLTGGAAAESDVDLLDRLLAVIRKPPAGGNRHDYKRWAMEVTGVQHAYVYPLRRGIGTVDVVITAAGGLPSVELIAATQVAIDAQRPVGARSVLVLAPTPRTVPVGGTIMLESGADWAVVSANVRTVIADYFAGMAPGDPVVRAKLLMRIVAVDGVADCDLSNPVANVLASSSAAAVEWLQLGALTLVRA